MARGSTHLLLLSIPFSADEWKPRHDLVSHTGVMNLTEFPSPSEVFFSGPASHPQKRLRGSKD